MRRTYKDFFLITVCVFVYQLVQVTHSLSCLFLVQYLPVCLTCGWSREELNIWSQTSGLGSDHLLKSPPPTSSSLSASDEPCLRQGAASSPALFVIILGTMKLMPPRIQRSLTPPHRPSMLPRLQLKMATHSPLLSKLWACKGMWMESSHVAPLKQFKLFFLLWFAVILHSDVGMCRICHEGAGGETLLSPCDCTGTLGKVHKSCLEKWLSSSNTSYCELCHTEFTIERRPQPLTQVREALLQWWMYSNWVLKSKKYLFLYKTKSIVL